MVPRRKKVGLLFCSAEPNSRYQIDEITKHLTAKGITCTEFAFTDSNDLAAVTEKAAASSDVIYIPTDNTAANNTESIANILTAAGVPAVCGEAGLCAGCGVCTLSIDYYDLGVTTGKMAARSSRARRISPPCPSNTLPLPPNTTPPCAKR